MNSFRLGIIRQQKFGVRDGITIVKENPIISRQESYLSFSGYRRYAPIAAALHDHSARGR